MIEPAKYMIHVKSLYTYVYTKHSAHEIIYDYFIIFFFPFLANAKNSVTFGSCFIMDLSALCVRSNFWFVPPLLFSFVEFVSRYPNEFVMYSSSSDFIVHFFASVYVVAQFVALKLPLIEKLLR